MSTPPFVVGADESGEWCFLPEFQGGTLTVAVRLEEDELRVLVSWTHEDSETRVSYSLLTDEQCNMERALTLALHAAQP